MNQMEIFVVFLTVAAVVTALPQQEGNDESLSIDAPADIGQIEVLTLNDENLSNLTDTTRGGVPINCGIVPPPPFVPNPTYPSITYSSNCDFCDHDLYTLTCIRTAFDCAARCALDKRCSHFTYIANINGGTCRLKTAFGSGGAWAVAIKAPSAYICGYIPRRAFSTFLLGICLSLDININI